MAIRDQSANIPNKVMQVEVTSIVNDEVWEFDDGQGDPFWEGGSSPVPYRWIMEMTINPQTHSSHLTRVPQTFNGLDIYVGDWLTNTGSATALEIIEVQAKTATTATLLVEDRDRYNTYKDPNQNGLGRFTPGTAVLFQLSDEGMPLIDPLPPTVTQVNFAPQLNARFRNFDKEQRYRLEKVAHGFVLGEVLAIDLSGDIVTTTGTTTDKMIGTVIEAGPGPNYFYLRPFTRVVEEYQPNLPGAVGSYLYPDLVIPGLLSTVQNGTPVLLRLTDPIPSNITSIDNPSITVFNSFNINGTLITITGSITTLTSDINLLTGTHGVIALEVPAPTIVDTIFANTGFGIVGGLPPFDVTINGSFVAFTTTTSGITFADETDIAFDINAAGIPNLVASSSGGKLILTETSGGTITIVNGTSDGLSQSFAGLGSVTGLDLVTVPTGLTALNLSQPDGLEILLENVAGDPLGDLGLFSVWNGRVPVALAVDQGIRRGDMFVVADIPARDAINALIGDQAYVIDTGESEFAMYLFDGTVWVQTGDQDSSNVDATTESITITSSDTFPALIHRVSDGARVVSLSVDVTIAFDGSPTIDVGDTTINDRLMPNAFVDLSTIGTYANTPQHQYNTGGTETELFVFLASPGTVGEALVTITYV